jgi:hypothetical protein
MRECKCEFCAQPFSPRQAGQRFCSRLCGLEYFQQEKRDAIAWYRRHREHIAQQQQGEASEREQQRHSA